MSTMNPKMGDIVLVRTPLSYNGSQVHPAIVTHAWGAPHGEGCAYLNVKVLPDCGSPHDETSIVFYESKEAGEAGMNPTRFAFPKEA